MVRCLSDIIIYYCKTVAGLEVFQLFDMPRGAYITPVAVEYGVGVVFSGRSVRTTVFVYRAHKICVVNTYHLSSAISLMRTYNITGPGPNR